MTTKSMMWVCLGLLFAVVSAKKKGADEMLGMMNAAMPMGGSAMMNPTTMGMMGNNMGSMGQPGGMMSQMRMPGMSMGGGMNPMMAMRNNMGGGMNPMMNPMMMGGGAMMNNLMNPMGGSMGVSQGPWSNYMNMMNPMMMMSQQQQSPVGHFIPGVGYMGNAGKPTPYPQHGTKPITPMNPYSHFSFGGYDAFGFPYAHPGVASATPPPPGWGAEAAKKV